MKIPLFYSNYIEFLLFVYKYLIFFVAERYVVAVVVFFLIFGEIIYVSRWFKFHYQLTYMSNAKNE